MTDAAFEELVDGRVPQAARDTQTSEPGSMLFTNRKFPAHRIDLTRARTITAIRLEVDPDQP